MLLLPPPQRLEQKSGRLVVADRVEIVLASPQELLAPAIRLQQAFNQTGATRAMLGTGGTRGTPPTRVTLGVDPGARGPESYRLNVGEEGVELMGHDPAGLFYGVCTLQQLLQLSGSDGSGRLELPELVLEDWPDFPHRGVMLDVSRDRVPRMDDLLERVDLLASWKYNQLQLYMEHTFAYRGHDRVWQDASPFTGEEILQLDAFCRQRHMELVPNQNSFGHMHRWLVHEPYRKLAECPEGIDHPFSQGREPYSLCPTDPGSLELLGDLYGQLLPYFTSSMFNVGLDETFDVGLGRSATRCHELGAERVYLEFLQAVHRLAEQHGRRIQFWGDIILKRPELVRELPRRAVALEWGYEADHPFDQHARHFAAAGLEFYVCPGTSSWNSIGGRVDNAVANIARAAESGKAAGATGVLVTDWGDNGHLQPPPVSLPGFVAGAACSWNTGEGATHLPEGATHLPALLDIHGFGDTAGVMGQVAIELGNVHLATGVVLRNGTILSRLLLDADAWPASRIPDGLDRPGLERAMETVERAVRRLDAARIRRADADLVVSEYRWVAGMLDLACRIGIVRLEAGLDRPLAAASPAARAPLARDMAEIIERHRKLWLKRSRPGGLDDSAARLQRTLDALEGTLLRPE